MKRSGNHAVINWMLSGGTFTFQNNVLPYSRQSGPSSQHYGRFAWRFLKSEVRAGHLLFPTRRMISVEDIQLGEPVLSGIPAAARNVLLLRSPDNLFASRIRKGVTKKGHAYSVEPADIQRSIDLWKDHAREFLGITNYLPNKIGIAFDRWVVDPSYRAKLAAILRINPDDGSLRKKATEGGGSSFDSEPNGILDRASLLNQSERILLDRLMEDPEVIQISNQLRLFIT